jgi:hypothetical protein
MHEAFRKRLQVYVWTAASAFLNSACRDQGRPSVVHVSRSYQAALAGLPTTAPVPGKPIIGNASLSRLSALEGRMRAMILDMKEKIEAHRTNSAGIRHCALLFPPPFA